MQTTIHRSLAVACLLASGLACPAGAQGKMAPPEDVRPRQPLAVSTRGLGGVVTMPVGGADKVVYEESHAVVVGINRYPTGSALRSLTFAVADAEAMRSLLVDTYGFPAENVRLITDNTRPRPTRQAIVDALTELSRIEKTSARVVFYFSGHGVTADVRGGKAGFLVPADAQLSRREVTSAGALDDACIAMTYVKRKLNICQARHRLLLFDACFSGLAITGRSAMRPQMPDYLRKVAFTPVLKVFAAGQAGEEVFEKPEWGHGAFTKRLLEVLTPNDAGAVLADMNGDGYVTTDELWGMVPTRVREMSQGRQNPQDAQEGEDKLLFVPATGTPAPAPMAQPDRSQLKLLNIAKVLRRDARGVRTFEWTLFVHGPPEVLDEIRSVRYYLHPTFRPNTVDVPTGQAQGFPITRTGWGVFAVKARVFFKDGTTKNLEHNLDFSVATRPQAFGQRRTPRREGFDVPQK